jgi:DinB family protein
MNETAQQYIQRMTAHVVGKDPLAVQAATARRLEGMIRGLPTAKLRKRPAPDKWSINEILAHLADSEIVLGFRMRMILAVPGTPIAAVEQDSWVTSGQYEKRDSRKSIEHFRVFREANLALLKSLTPEQWKQYGMHSERGRETIEHIVRIYAGHDINHLQQIERILSAKLTR